MTPASILEVCSDLVRETVAAPAVLGDVADRAGVIRVVLLDPIGQGTAKLCAQAALTFLRTAGIKAKAVQIQEARTPRDPRIGSSDPEDQHRESRIPSSGSEDRNEEPSTR